MPRTARKISQSGYMHVIARGIGKQLLFESPADYRKYLILLRKYCEETGVKICAFCLMENHVHLITISDKDALVQMMKKLGISYAGYYNYKYERTGHLFQDRFLSEPIENEQYLLTVFRYVLQNPQKAGICRASDYTWSSYSLYESSLSFMELKLIRELVGDKISYEKYIASQNIDECLEFHDRIDKDAKAIGIINNSLGLKSGTELQKMSKKERDKALSFLIQKGLSIRQIERLTGINRNIVQRVNRDGSS